MTDQDPFVHGSRKMKLSHLLKRKLKHYRWPLLLLPRENGKKLLFLTDSCLVGTIHDGSDPFWESNKPVEDFYSNCTHFDCSRVEWIRRENNTLAHDLSQLGF